MTLKYNLLRSLKRCASILLGLCALQSQSLAQEAPVITSVTVNDAGRIVITFDGPAGEYLVESNDDLAAGEWGSLCRLSSDGNGAQASEPIDLESGQKFFRIFPIAASDDAALTSSIASELDDQLSNPTNYDYLGPVFGLTFPIEEAQLLGANGLSSAARNTRVYTAAIGTLAGIAQFILDQFPSGGPPPPSSEEIVTALMKDLSDNIFDGKFNGDSIAVGNSGVTLPDFTEQDFINGMNAAKAEISGLYNIFFTASGTGTTTVSVPAEWGTFYWDSADWQYPSAP